MMERLQKHIPKQMVVANILQWHILCGCYGFLGRVCTYQTVEGTTMTRLPRVTQAASVALCLWGLAASTVLATPFVQTDLVSDISGLAAITDPSLINPWGLAHSSTSPFWISDQGTNVATLYAVTGSTNVTKTVINPPSGFVSIPTTASGPQGPTGQINNTNTASFQLTPGTPSTSARFIFANLNGTISGWAGGPASSVQVTTPGAVYTGLAINQAQTRLYAANDAGTGGINVFDSSFAPVSLPGAFLDPNLPAGFVPFNVQDIGGKVYVTYAPAGHAAQAAATPGTGIVDIFDENGVFQQRVITGSQLAAPWGITLAPAGFGPFGGDLLVGNFSYVDSEINAFDPINGAYLGTIPIDVGNGNTPGGLWSLNFGIGGNNGSPTTLYFTDGLDGETHGLFAAIAPVPEPGTLALLAAGIWSLWVPRRRRSSRARGGLVGSRPHLKVPPPSSL
jgi:uncharacterized protein (TIGR03118 family)